MKKLLDKVSELEKRLERIERFLGIKNEKDTIG